MTLPEDTTPLTWEKLLALVAQLAASNEALQAENAELKRGAKPQAVPFSKGTQVNNPKRPRRQPGEGTFSFP